MRAWAVLICLLAGCSATPAEAPAEVAPSSIRGIVVDATITPVADALVQIGSTAATRSGPDGGFAFHDVAPGLHILHVEADGFLPLEVEAVAAVAPEPVKAVMTRLPSDAARIVYTYFEGYIGCSVHLLSVVQDDACNAVDPDIRAPLVFGEAKQPTFLQTEIAWDATQVFGQRLTAIQSIGATRIGNVWGQSPLTCRVGPEACANPDGTGGGGGGLGSTLWTDSVDIVLYANCVAQCVPGTALGVGVAAQQGYQVYGSLFYAIEPREGWTFIGDGEHP